MADEKKPEGGGFGDVLLAPLTAFLSWLEHPHKFDSEKNPIDKWFTIRSWVEWGGKKGVSRGLSYSLLLFTFTVTAITLMPEYPRLVAGWFVIGFPIGGPIAGAGAFWATWMWYIQSLYIFGQKHVLLEIRMPAEISKSPRAMEQALILLQVGSGETTFIDKYWKGGTRPFFSLEIASFGGDVHFYIWCRAGLRNLVESALYAHYPELEIVEAEDYSLRTQYNPLMHDAFVTAYKYAKPDAYPIRSYIDFELDADPKEEFKVDPIAQMIEGLSSVAPGNQVWTQIVFEMEKKGDETALWSDRVVAEVNKIRADMSLGAEGKDAGTRFPRPAWRQTKQLEAMERHLGKYVYHVGIRSIYLAQKGKTTPSEITTVRSLFAPFGNPGWLNSIGAGWGENDFDFPWQDYKDMRRHLTRRRFIDAYRRRLFFHSPWQQPHMTMTNEAIATLWHPPSRAVVAPGLRRIPTSKAEPPPNLPM